MSADGLMAGADAAPALSGAAVTLAGASLLLRPAGSLWWPEEGLLCVGDLHLGRAERMARQGGGPIRTPRGASRLGRRGVAVARRCFLADSRRLVLPAFGTYAGGVDARDPAFDALLERDARAWLLGREVAGVPRRRLDG